jgi:rhomboid protease GluP
MWFRALARAANCGPPDVNTFGSSVSFSDQPDRTAAPKHIPIQECPAHNGAMLRRQKSGSVICPSCGNLVGIRDEQCWNCGRRNPGMWGFAPFLRRLHVSLGLETIVIGGCSALYVATLLVDPGGIQASGGGFSILAPSFRSLFLFGSSGALPVFGYGRWWTILSAGWLHANLLHILFNMLWVRQIAPATMELYGAGRAVIIYTVSSAVGFLVSSFAGLFMASAPLFSLRGAGFTLGASAPIFGLFGALVAYGRKTGSSQIRGQAISYAAILFVFGFMMPGIDNYAHFGGFAGGYVCAELLNPLQRERDVHLLAAYGCLAATALAIVASIVQGAALR